jgi:hypothetical protein
MASHAANVDFEASVLRLNSLQMAQTKGEQQIEDDGEPAEDRKTDLGPEFNAKPSFSHAWGVVTTR